MPKLVSSLVRAFSTFECLQRSSQAGVVILLGLSLTIVSPLSISGQINQQQQEQQHREEQQRQEQAREQQQRDQEERDRQAREEQQRQEQQREEQQRQEQAREQQQRDQEERDRQAREEQQRQEQQREEQQRQEQVRAQQQRDQQQRDELQRQEQERQHQAPVMPVHSSPPSHPVVNSPVIGATPSLGNTDLRRKPCDKKPCVQPKPVLPNPVVKLCKGSSCPVCGPGQSPGKENSCVPAAQAKAASAPPKPNVLPQSCVAGQVWNGVQCAPIAPQQCLPGQTTVGSSCQADCTLATAGAQSYIELLRMARQDKDSACLKNPTGGECRSADLTYQMRLNEYRAFLGGVSTQCTLPDPISI